MAEGMCAEPRFAVATAAAAIDAACASQLVLEKEHDCDDLPSGVCELSNWAGGNAGPSGGELVAAAENVSG